MSLLFAARPVTDIFPFMRASGEVHPPFYFYWLHPWVLALYAGAVGPAVPGWPELWLRASSLPWIVLACLLLYRIAAAAAGQRAAIMATALYIASAYASYYGRELRMYPMLTALVLGATWSAWCLWHPPHPRRAALGVALYGLGAFFTHYLAVLFLLPVTVALLMPRADGARLPRDRQALALLPLLLVGLLWSPVVRAQAAAQPLGLREAQSWPQLIGLLYQLHAGVTWGVPLPDWPDLVARGLRVAPVCWLGLLAAVHAVVAAWRAPGMLRVVVVGQLMAVPLLVLGVSAVTTVRIFEYKYFQATVPFLCLAWALPLSDQALASSPRVVAWLPPVLMLALQLAASAHERSRLAWYGPQDWREAAQVLAPAMAARSVVLVHPSMMAAPLMVYASLGRPGLLQPSAPGSPPRCVVVPVNGYEEVVERAPAWKAAAASGDLWYVDTPYHPFVSQQHLLDRLLASCAVVERRELESFWPANRLRIIRVADRLGPRR